MMSKHSSPRSPFIVFEGIDASGKGTQIALLAEYLQERGIPTVTTREPGGVPAAEIIRNALLGGSAKDLGPIAEAMLFNAARTHHLKELIRPALADGKAVTCDRFTASTVAYQGAGNGVDLDWLEAIQTAVVGPTIPTAVIVLDIPVELSQERQIRRGGNKDRFESEQRSFHERLRQKYFEISEKNTSTYFLIDGTLPPDAVHRDILNKISHLLV